MIQVPRPSRRERGREELRVPRREQAHSQNKAGRGCASELLRVVQGQLKACRRQRAGGLPSPVSCRGHRYRVGEGYWSYKDWEMAEGGLGSLQIQALPTAPEVLWTFFYPHVEAAFSGSPNQCQGLTSTVYRPRLAPFLSEAWAQQAWVLDQLR